MKKNLTILMLACSFFAKAQTSIDNEPTNNTTPGVTFALPVNNNANISSSSDIDFYKVDVVTPGVLVINVSGMNTNMLCRIEVFNANGSANANSEGYKLSTVAAASSTLEIIAYTAGVYYIKISNGQNTTSSSPYNVSINIDNSDIYEYNNDASSLGATPAMNISMNPNLPTVINGKLFGYERLNFTASYTTYANFVNLSPDIDLYKINVTKAGTIVINLSNIPTNIAGSIEVYNSNGTSANGFSEGYKEATVTGGTLNFELLTKTTGDYYVMIYNSDAASNGANTSNQAYTLSMSIDTLGSEYNDNANVATSISLNSNILGKIRGYQRLNFTGAYTTYANFPKLTADVDYYKTSTTIPNFMYAKVSNVASNLTMRITALANDGITILGSKTATVAGTDITLLAGDIINPSTLQYFIVEDVNLTNGTNTSDQPYNFIVSTFPLSTHSIISSNRNPAYPNPSQGIINLDLLPNEYYDLITIDGRKIISNSKRKTISLKDFSNNLFIIKYYKTDGTLIRNEKIYNQTL